jgi:cytochrome P450 family 710 subfamily A protein
MVLDPYEWWEKQRLYNTNGLSWNAIAGQFLVFSSNAETTAKVCALQGTFDVLSRTDPEVQWARQLQAGPAP